MTEPRTSAVDFLQRIIAGDIREAYEAHTTPDFRHHNAYFPGDKEALIKGMQDNHEHFPEKIFQIHQVISEGPLVAVHSLLKFNPGHTGIAVVHLFRFEGAKIAEFWDVAQMLPDRSPNENGPL